MADASTLHIKCNACNAAIDRCLYNTGQPIPCRQCQTPVMAEVFPAHDNGMELGRSGETILIDSDASCFYHPKKKVATACSSCGRFLCLLCDISLNDEHFCAACIESSRKKGKLKNIENSHVRYDRITLTAAFLPMLFPYIIIFTAPLTLFLVPRHWKDEMGVIPHSKAGYVVAFIFALLQLFALAAIIVAIVVAA